MKHLFILIPFMLFFQAVLPGKSYDFLHLDVSSGLSNNSVECIFRDSRGFVWFATGSGLNRYDGANFKIYKHDRNNPDILPYDRISGIQEDMDGNLWMHIRKDLYMLYDYKTERFISNTDSVWAVAGFSGRPDIIETDKEKNVYLYYKKEGIYKIDSKTGNQKLIKQTPDYETGSEGVSQMKIRGNHMWLLYFSGLLEMIDIDTGKTNFSDSRFLEKHTNSYLSGFLFIDSGNQPWIYPGIHGTGVDFYDDTKSQWISMGTEGDISLSAPFVRQVAEDKDGNIWIGTDHGGVCIFDRNTQQITSLKNDFYDANSLSQNSIISIYCDDKGIVWVGTYKNGVSYYYPGMFRFKKPLLYNRFLQMGQIPDCNSLLKDSKEILWIGTNGQGLVRYSEKNNEHQVFLHDPSNPESISSDIITSLYEDHAGVIWAGTFLGGLNKYENGKFRRYQTDFEDSGSLSNPNIYGITEDEDNNLWVATLGGGMNKLDVNRNHFTRYTKTNTQDLLSDYILSVFKNGENSIYLCTSSGLNYIDETGNIKIYFNDNPMAKKNTSFPLNNVICDSRGLVWMATSAGIRIFNPSTGELALVTMEDGLPDEGIVSLTEDKNGAIWAGTLKGLAFINYISPSEISITTYTTDDGLPGDVFNQNAIYQNADGTLYLGTTKGYVAFHPEKLAYDPPDYQPHFTGLRIANEVITPAIPYNGRYILKRSIVETEELVLKYNETNLSLSFSSLNYIHSGKNCYRYRLAGLENEWTEITSNVGSVSYSNLNPGKYKLIVYPGNRETGWLEYPLEMRITVNPPFWLSWWAYFFYFLILTGIIAYILYYNLHKHKKEFIHAEKIMEAQKRHELDEMKLQFFTNISHEFKTPLTLILTPVDKLLKEVKNEEHQHILGIMQRNARNLLNMVNEILDFRKLDLNKMTLNPATGDIIAYIREVVKVFSPLAVQKNISLTFNTYREQLNMEFDPEKINKIITNLLSNAFKYTPENGNIEVSISITEKFDEVSSKSLCIKIRDNGIGMENSQLSRIFDRFYRIENPAGMPVEGGTGVGLHLVSEYVKLHRGKIQVESVPGAGSVFSVCIPFRESCMSSSGSGNGLESSYTKEKTDKPEEIREEKHQFPLLLVVDDNEDFRSFMKSIFQVSYRVITATDGEEAGPVILEQLPDLILCDVMMPRKDGYQLCRDLKNDIRTSHIPVILLTAKSSEENKYSGIEAGADDYISKPFNVDLLSLKIARIIEKQKTIRNSFKNKVAISPNEIEIISMDEKFVKKAVAIVEENMANPEFLVEDLCREMGMSRVYFYKKILTLTDKTPSGFIRFIRLKRAADLLEKSQLFVNEVAFRVGFNDPKYFRKYFKEEFGITPTEYKKKFVP